MLQQIVRLYRAIYSTIFFKITRPKFSLIDTDLDEENIHWTPSFSLHDLVDTFQYKDESWNYVKHLNDVLLCRFLGIDYNKKIPDNHCTNNKVSYFTDKDTLKLCSKGKCDDWIYLFNNELDTTCFKLQFFFSLKRPIKEFQIAFRHTSITDRLRFQLVDNRYFVFEVVSKGFFLNHAYETPFHIQEKQEYELEILLINNHYQVRIDGQRLLHIQDTSNNFTTGGLALILWDNTGHSNIQASISNFSAHQGAIQKPI